MDRRKLDPLKRHTCVVCKRKRYEREMTRGACLNRSDPKDKRRYLWACKNCAYE